MTWRWGSLSCIALWARHGRTARACSTALTVSCSALLATGSSAQTPADSACRATLVDVYAPSQAYWAERTPGAVYRAIGPLERDGRWEDAFKHIVQLFREDEQFFEGTAAGQYALYLDSLMAFGARLGSVLAASSSDQVVENATLFMVDEDPNADGAYLLLKQRIRVTRDSSDRARSLCLTSHTVHRLHERFAAPARLATERALRERVKRWDAFNERGLTPFPWELALNEAVHWLGKRESLEPPRVQLIALRPTAAVEVDGSLGSRINVLAVELGGIAWYFGGRGAYLAASALMVSPSESKAGYGAMIRIAPWFTGGPVWRDVDGDGVREKRWVLSLDAFDLLSGAPKSLIEAARQATGGRSRQ